jgi:hypothetical protein
MAGLALLWAPIAANAQSYRGQAEPIVGPRNPVEFSGFEFQTIVFGHEGPMPYEISGPPIAGREYLVEADIFGIDSAATIRFELIDASGGSARTLAMWKESDTSDDGQFAGWVEVPARPFRIVASGTATSGTAFRTASTLFEPAATGAPDDGLPPGLPEDRRSRVQSMLEDATRLLQAHAARVAAEHPDGSIALARAIVSPIDYEPLTSPAGDPIGIRVRYSIEFPARLTISAIPSATPAYPDSHSEWRGVEMKPLTGTISPSPQLESVAMRDVIVHGAGATYQPGSYSFTVDLIPDYVLQGTEPGRFCINEHKFGGREVWDALIASEAAVPYRLWIRDTETSATIPTFFPQRSFYRSFRAAGARDCNPPGNARF